MAVTFPNRARSFDAARRCVRFLGYDGMFEVPFFVEVGALSKSHGTSESDYLSAFDSARALITDVAREVYSRGRKTRYVLTAADFR